MQYLAVENRMVKPPRRWWLEWELAALTLLVVAIYFTRLTAMPVCGEESRWANAAREMIATGDWIVPRQQGTIFPERPPLNSWAMAVVGMLRGEVDLVAIRLPSAIAILLTTWLIYGYARSWITRLGSFSAALAFATGGQVLMLGRLGESEAVFTLFVAGSLLAWHWAYLLRRPTLAWTAGYTLCALGTLTKGIQAPVYFILVCNAYLALQRDWRTLLHRGQLVGLACFAGVFGAWFIPFASENPDAVRDIMSGLAQDRIQLAGLAKHLVKFPFETLGCLLPWSPLLLALVKPATWRTLLAQRPPMRFLLVALALTYPSVWLAAGARGRYYMPLYPCLTLLIGLCVEHYLAQAASLADRLIWRRFLRGLGLAAIAGGVVIAAASLLPIERLEPLRQPPALLALWLAAALPTGGVLIWASLNEQTPRPQVALCMAAAFIGLAQVAIVLNVRVHGGNDLAPAVARVKSLVAKPAELVSLGRIYHRFAYQYDTPIKQVDWPLTAEQLPGEVTYFCFDRRPGDTPQWRSGSDGRKPERTPGTLPFEWDVVAEIPCDPVQRSKRAHDRSVIIGRVRRTTSLASPAVSPPERR